LRDTLYITFNSRGIVKSFKTMPALGGDEYLFKLDMEVPDSVFKPASMPVVKIKLDGPQIQPAAVSVNGEAQELPANMDKASRVQAEMLRHLATMIQAGRWSNDISVQHAADNALKDLLAAGVDVKIEGAEGAKS
jgi:hypothetical protein